MKNKIIIFIKVILILVLVIISVKFILDNNYFKITEKIYSKHPNLQYEYRNKLFKRNKSYINNLKNDYNVKFLPETQFTDLNFIKKKINFSESFKNTHNENKIKGGYAFRYKSFFLDKYVGGILITDFYGNTYFVKNKQIINKTSLDINPLIIKNNLEPTKILDSLVDKNLLYVSYYIEKKGCQLLSVSKAEINMKEMKFIKVFSSDECGNYVQAGRMVMNIKDKNNNLLLSTTNQTPDKITDRPQNDDSIFGKVISINLDDNKSLIYSKGHRNIQGLYIDNDVIISTEHGPRGGDEINKIEKGKNYGWPIASYGETYSKQSQKKTIYLKSHEDNSFVEPIYSFVPSIGISEIIRLSNNFSTLFQNNFILTSLFDRSIYRIKFDNSFNKILFKEKIYINERVRDIKYSNELSVVLLALEEKGELGILSINN
jgi:hypothetical protein